MLNENADPDVRADMETFMSRVVPEGTGAPWTHTDEGYDDMPAHCKAAMFGSSLTLPITRGRLALGTWQGVWLAEHRNDATSRRRVRVAGVQGWARGAAPGCTAAGADARAQRVRSCAARSLVITLQGMGPA